MIKPVYLAETSLFVGKENSLIGSIDLNDFSLDQKLVTDYREIIKSKLVSKEVIEKLNLDMDVETFHERMSVTTIKDSRFFKISFESTDPQIAMDVANSLAEVIIKKAEEVIEVKNIKVIDVAELPKSPIKPNKKMNIAIAGVLGIMLGVFLVFTIEYMDHTIKGKRDVERYLGLNTIGEIPAFKGERRHYRNAHQKT
jgi:succinoglycan biosynthesis transport protein ExoP